MYGCETWKMIKSDVKKIDVFQNGCLRRILKIRWQDRITNKEVLQMAEMENLSDDVRRRRWKFIPSRDDESGRGADRRKHGEGRQREKEKELDGKNWIEVRIAAAGRAARRESVEALCVTWHEADR